MSLHWHSHSIFEYQVKTKETPYMTILYASHPSCQIITKTSLYHNKSRRTPLQCKSCPLLYVKTINVPTFSKTIKTRIPNTIQKEFHSSKKKRKKSERYLLSMPHRIRQVPITLDRTNSQPPIFLIFASLFNRTLQIKTFVPLSCNPHVRKRFKSLPRGRHLDTSIATRVARTPWLSVVSCNNYTFFLSLSSQMLQPFIVTLFLSAIYLESRVKS